VVCGSCGLRAPRQGRAPTGGLYAREGLGNKGELTILRSVQGARLAQAPDASSQHIGGATVDCEYCEDSRGTPYLLYGVNGELIRWLRDGHQQAESLAYRALVTPTFRGDPKGLLDVMLVVLGGSLGHDFQAAERFMYEHWHAHPQLGPYPCPYLLGEHQASGVFHREYRDHVAHQLKTYLLGLYVFDRCSRIRECVLRGISKDMGTTDPRALDLIENRAVATGHPPAAGGGPSWEEFKERFKEMLNRPLRKTVPPSDGEALEEFRQRVDELAQTVKVRRLAGPVDENDLANIPDFSRRDAAQDPEAAWVVLGPVAKHAHLGRLSVDGRDAIKKYFQFTLSKPTIYDVTLPDHGVASSLLLLRLWYAYRNFLQDIKAARDDTRTADGLDGLGLTLDWIDKTTDLLDERRIQAAAGVIALHNIDPKRYRVSGGGTWIAWKRDFSERLQLSLCGENGILALAFLLRLTDTLQDWDRCRFRPLREGERLLESRDFSLRVGAAEGEDGKILVLYRADFPPGRGRPWPPDDTESQYGKLLTELSECLDGVESVIDFDGVGSGKESADREATWKRATEFCVHALDGERAPKARARRKSRQTRECPPVDEDCLSMIRTLLADPNNPASGFPVRACKRAPQPNSSCEVRAELLHFAADTARTGSALGEMAQLVQYMVEAAPHLDRVLLFIDGALPRNISIIDVVTSLEELRKRLRLIRQLFTVQIAPRRRYSNDNPTHGGRGGRQRRKLSARWRLRKFLHHRLMAYPEDIGASDTAKEIADAICTVASRLSNKAIQEWRQQGLGAGDDVRRKLVPIDRHLRGLSRQLPSITKTFDDLVSGDTLGIHKAFDSSLTPEATDTRAALAAYIRDRIKGLPHNDGPGGCSWWKSTSTGGSM